MGRENGETDNNGGTPQPFSQFVDPEKLAGGTADAGTADAGTADAGTADAGTADAGSADAGTAPYGRKADGTPRQKPGRKSGPNSGGQRKSSGSSQASLAGFADVLFFVHKVASAVTKIPEFELDEKEAKELEKAAANVSRHYDIVIDEKTADWVKLGTVIATVYGTRAFAYRNRKSREEKVRPIRPENAAP